MNSTPNPLIPFIYSFYISLTLRGVFLTLSRLELWLVLEIATFVFIGLSLLRFVNYGTFSRGLLTYFLVQSGMSILLLFSLLNLLSGADVYIYFVYLTIIGKLGVLPLGIWVYPVISQLSGLSLFNVMTFQKLPLFMLLSGVSSLVPLVRVVLVFNLIIGGAMALSASDLTSLLVFRSISNNTWLWFSLWGNGITAFLAFYVVYSLGLYLSVLAGSTPLTVIGVLSLSGLPPFPLFFSKLAVVFSVLHSVPNSYGLIVIMAVLISTFLVRSSYVRYVSHTFTSRLGLVVYVSKDSPFN